MITFDNRLKTTLISGMCTVFTAAVSIIIITRFSFCEMLPWRLLVLFWGFGTKCCDMLMCKYRLNHSSILFVPLKYMMKSNRIVFVTGY